MASKGLAALTPNGLRNAYKEIGNFVTRGANKVDPRLRDVLREASNRFPGYEVQAYSGYRPTSKSGTSRHTKGQAIDIRLVEKATGRVLPNYQTPETFRVYEQFAQVAKQVQQEKYPELAESFRWGGYFGGPIGKYGAIDLMHFDIKPGGAMSGGSWDDGLTDAQRGLLAGATSRGLNQISLPNEVGVPPTREQGLAGTLTPEQMGGSISPQDQALANAQIAYGASRAANMQPPSLSPPNPGALRGLNVPSALSRPSAPPSNFSVPARPSPIGSAPLGQVTRAPLGPALARPSPPPSNFAKGTMPATPKENRIGGMDYAVAPERFGPAPVNAVRPSLAPSGLPAARMQSTVASRPATPAPTGLPAARQQTTVATRPNTPAPTGLPAAPSQASVMGALSQRAGLEAIKDASLAGPVPAPAINPAIANLPSRPINQVVPPVAMPPVAMPTVLAPPPAVYQPRPVSQVAPIAMRPTPPASAYDVYAGRANSAMDNTGRNRVDSLPGGVTSVTNQYGATTGMTPGGYQTAVGSMPSIPGMSMPSKSTVGGALKGGLVGAGVAGPVGGVIGALAGALAAKAIADRKGTTAATPGQPSGGLGGLFGGLFGGRASAPAGSSSRSSSGGASRSSGVGSYGKSGSGSYGSNPNSNSLRI